jgi:hypothetical protein
MRLTIIGLLVLGLGVSACARAEEESADAPSDAAAAVEEEAQEEAPAREEGGDAAADEAAVAPEAAPARQDAENPAMRNWVLLEFVRTVEEADVEWLEYNGFRVDTVMSGNLVRGWLEVPGGGEVIARDARIARVSAQAR